MDESGGALAGTSASGWGPDAKTIGRWTLGGLVLPIALFGIALVPMALIGGPEAVLQGSGMVLLVGLMVGIPAAVVGAVLGLVAVVVAGRLPRLGDPRRRTALALGLVAWWLVCTVLASLLLRLTASDGLSTLQLLVAGALPALVPTAGAFLTWRRRA